jgi:cation diffusion facilitator CzcD-associated flavoprotein CzcO
MPAFEGMSEFGGRLIHPQKWPEDLDYSDKNVTIIGSGATGESLFALFALFAS